MSDSSSIEWCDTTWNPILGCKRVSPGCDRCYAIVQARIRAGNPNPKVSAAFAGLTERTEAGIDWTGRVRLLPDRLAQPLGWRKPRKVFVNSLSDLFHEDVPDEYIACIFVVMAKASQHTFQILTKRHGRMRSLLNSPAFRVMCFAAATSRGWDLEGVPWPLPNVWLGVSVEDQKWADIRIPVLIQTPAAVRFLSCEPLLGPIDLSRWIGDGSGVSAEPRERGLRGRPPGRVDDRPGGAGLEDCGAAREPLVREFAPDSVRAPACGERHRQVPPGPRDVSGIPGARASASPGVATSQWPDTGRPDDQSQEWPPRGELAGESGTGDIPGAGDSRSGSAPSRSTGSVWAAQRDGEVDNGASAGDLLAPSLGGTADGNSGGLRGSDADHFQDRAGRSPISWLICGGESGPGARPMVPAWVRSLRDQCQSAGVPFLFKQWGAHRWVAHSVWDEATQCWVDRGIEPQRVSKKLAGRELDGRTWDEFPRAAEGVPA